MAETDIKGAIGYDYDPSAIRQAAADALRLSESLKAVDASFDQVEKSSGGSGAAVATSAQQLHAVAEVAGRVKAGLDDVWGTMGAATEQSKAYESTLAMVATLGDEAAAHQGQYRQEILQTATALGVDAVGAANALYDALSSGIPADNALAFMATASKAAVAGATDTETAVRGISATLNAWQLDASEAGRVSDVFFQGVNAGVFRFDELAGSIGQVAPMAAAMGISFEEVAAATATLTKGGLTASEAITQQRASISALITPNAQMSVVLKQLAIDNKAVAQTAAEQGISIGEAALRTLGYQGTMEQLRESSKNAGVELATATGSVQALGAVLGLTGEKAEGARADLDQMQSSAGSTGKAFGIMSETFEGTERRLEALKQQGMIGLGDAMKAALLPVMQSAIGLLQPLVDWFSKLGDGSKAGVGTVLLLAGGLGTLVTSLVLGKAAFDALHISATLAATGLTGVQMAIAATGIGALIVTIGLLVKGFNDLAAAQKASFEQAQRAGGGFDAYVAAAKRAQDQSTGLARVAGVLTQEALRQDLQVQSAGRAYLEYSLGVDKALLSSKDFLAEEDKLRQSFREGKVNQEQYQQQLVALADRQSIAAGSGHVLTASQREIADGWIKSASAALQQGQGISDATLKSEKYQQAAKTLSEAVAAGTITQEQAKTQLAGLAQALDSVAEKTAAAAREQAAAAGTVQTYGDSFSTLLHAGSKWTDDAEAMAKAQKDADAAMSQSVQSTMGQIWQAHKDLPGKLAAARAADAQAAASANSKRAADEQAHQRKMEDLQYRADNAKSASAQRSAARAIEVENQKWATLQATATSGGGSQTAAVEAEYAKQLAAAKESLAQTVVEYVKTQVMLGQTSEATARAIFTELKAGFPGIEIINPVEEASLHLMATVHDAAAGSAEAMAAIRPAIGGVVDEMMGYSAQDAELTNQVVAGAGARGDAVTGEAGVVAAAGETRKAVDADVMAVAQTRHGVVLATSADEQQAMTDTANVARTAGTTTGGAMVQVGRDAQAGAAGVTTGTGTMRSAIAGLPGAVAGVAGQVKANAASMGDGFTVAAQKAQEGQRNTLLALEEQLSRQKSGMDETTRAGLTGEDSHKRIAVAAAGSKQAVADYGEAASKSYADATRAGKENQEQVDRLATSLKAVPRDTRTAIQLAGAEKFKADVLEIIADLKNIPQTVNVRVNAVYTGSGPMEQGHSLKLQHDLEDIYNVVKQNGDLVVTGRAELDGPLVPDSSGKLAWQVALEAYYAKLAEAPQYVDRFMAIVGAAMGMGGNWSQIVDEWSNQAIRGWLDVQAAIGEPGTGKNVQLPDYRKLTGDPETAKKEWERFWNDVARQEEERARHADEFFTRQSRRFDQGGNETMSEKIEQEWDLEKQRHESVMNMIEQERIASERYFERNGDYYKALIELRKQLEDAIKAQQKSEEDAEKRAHDEFLVLLDAQKEDRQRVHDIILGNIAERRRVEDDASKAALAGLDEVAKHVKADTDRLTADWNQKKADFESWKVSLDIDGAKARLEELRGLASEFKDTMGSLTEVESDPRKAAEEERKRQTARVKLASDAQKDMLRKYRDMAGSEDQRTIDLLLQGESQRKTAVDRIFAEIQASLGQQASAQEQVVSAKERELAAQQALMTQAEKAFTDEKDRNEKRLKAIEDLKGKEKERHDAVVTGLEREKAFEDQRYKHEMQAIAEVKEAEDIRHKAKVRAIQQEYALQLMMIQQEGETIEERDARVARTLKEQQDAAYRAQADAEGRFSKATADWAAREDELNQKWRAHEAEILARMAEARQQLIRDMAEVARSIGGDAGNAIADLLEKLLGPGGLPAVEAGWGDVGDAGVTAVGRITEAVVSLNTQLGAAIGHQLEIDKRQAETHRAQQRYALSAAAEKNRGRMITTRKGRGGFRFTGDWEAYHGTPIDDGTKATSPEFEAAAGFVPGAGIGGGSVGDIVEPAPGGGGGAGEEPTPGGRDPWDPFKRRAKDAGKAVLADFIEPMNAGLLATLSLLRDIGSEVGRLPGLPILPPSGSTTGGGAGTGAGRYTHYGDNVIVDAESMPDELMDGLLGAVGLGSP